MNTRWEYDIYMLHIQNTPNILILSLPNILFTYTIDLASLKDPLPLTNLLYVPKYQTNCNRISNSIPSNERTSFQSATNSWVSVPQTNHVPGFCKQQICCKYKKPNYTLNLSLPPFIELCNSPLVIIPYFTSTTRTIYLGSNEASCSKSKSCFNL